MNERIDRSEDPFGRTRRGTAPSSRRDARLKRLLAIGPILVGLLLGTLPARADVPFGKPFLPLQVSTVPENGDLNPYGLVFVPPNVVSGGLLKPGELLISNFNDTSLQGRGSTIITIDPKTGETGPFFKGTAPIGFTNALVVAKVGLVFAGSVLTTDGMSDTAASGGLLVIDSKGHLLTTLGTSALIDGPWGLAIHDLGSTAQLFVSNVFNGTITRLTVAIGPTSITVKNQLTIASGYGFGPDSGAVVVGPAGLAYDAAHDTLFVASEKDDEIFALKGAGKTQTNLGTGTPVYQDPAHLHGPLGLIFAPNGNLLVANADPAVSQDQNVPSEIVEFTRSGHFVREFSVDPNLGAAFALGIESRVGVDVFAYVDDFLSNCTILDLAPGM
jgi:hypothetical protein